MWVFLLFGVEVVKIYKVNLNFVIGMYSIFIWMMLIGVLFVMVVLVLSLSFWGYVVGLVIGYGGMFFLIFNKKEKRQCVDVKGVVGLGYVKFFVLLEKILRWIEGKLNLLGRLLYYVSIDQKMYGRFGVLFLNNIFVVVLLGVVLGLVGSIQRLGFQIWGMGIGIMR